MTPSEPVQFPSSLLFNGKLYHQHHGEQPQMVSMIWGRNLASRSDPGRHRVTVGADWVDATFLPSSFVIIHNRPVRRQTIPTPEERAADDARVVELSFGKESADLVVRPGEFQPLSLSHSTSLRMRCSTGTVEVEVHTYPE